MTSIAYKDGVMAGDGRMTIGSTVTSDKTTKIFKINNCLVGFAGRYSSGLRFVDWFEGFDLANKIQEQEPFVSVNIPDFLPDEEFTAIVAYPPTPDYPEGIVMQFEGGNAFFEIEAPCAIGSGSDFLIGAMDAGASAEQAVIIATKRDTHSGGEVKTITFDEQDEIQEFTRESLKDLSKEEILEKLFGNEEQDAIEESTPDVKEEEEEEVDITTNGEDTEIPYDISVYSDDCGGIVVYAEDGKDYQFWIEDGIEYEDFTVEDLKICCDTLKIIYAKNANKKQLAKLIVKFYHEHKNPTDLQ